MKTTTKSTTRGQHMREIKVRWTSANLDVETSMMLALILKGTRGRKEQLIKLSSTRIFSIQLTHH
jgi:hypothetical protein